MNLDKSILRGINSKRRTESLFHETIGHEAKKRYTPIYTMKEEDFKGLPSAYRIYMESVDEYEAALTLVGSIAHWEACCKSPRFMEGTKYARGLLSWRDDMKRRDESLAKKVLMQEVAKGSVVAAKALADFGGKPLIKKAKGKSVDISLQIEEDDKNLENLHKNLVLLKQQ